MQRTYRHIRTTFAMLFLSLLSLQYVNKILPPLSLSRCFDWAIQNKNVHGMMPRENEKDCPNLLTPAFCLTHNIFPFSSSHPFLQHSRINLSLIQIYWTTNHLVHLSKCSTGKSSLKVENSALFLCQFLNYRVFDVLKSL